MGLLIIDESLSKRLATQLAERGRPAQATSALGLTSKTDPEMLADLADRFRAEPWVLVTGDDAMPAAHADIVGDLGITIATIDPRWMRSGLEHEAYKREVVHRWAHHMATLAAGEVHRYSERSHRVWSPQRHHSKG